MFSDIIAPVSRPSPGRAVTIAVYLSHTEISMRKLNPNPKMSATTSLGLTAGLLSSDNDPIESASPNIKSERDSILGFGIRPLKVNHPRGAPSYVWKDGLDKICRMRSAFQVSVRTSRIANRELDSDSRLSATVIGYLKEDWFLRCVRTVDPNPDEMRALGKFMLDAWKRAGPGALGWTGASEDTIQEISSENYLKKLVSNPKMRFFASEENGEITGFATNRVQDDSTMELAGIIVREDLLSQGIGSLLLSKCVEFAKEAGFVNMVVKTETLNE